MEGTKKGRGRSKSTQKENNSSSEETVAKSVPDMNGESGNDEEKPVDKSEEDTQISSEAPKDAPTSENSESKTEEAPPEKGRGKKRKLVPDLKTGEESASEESINDPKETALQESKLSEKDDSSANESSSDLNLPPKQTLGKGKRARIPNKRYSDILLSPQSRTHNKSTPSVENGEKVEPEIETSFNIKVDEVSSISNLSKSRTETSSPASKRTKFNTDLADPIYRKPFIYGWKRELVYRATNDNPNKRNGDIYYYTPTGKKVRSMREVAENLKSKDLSMDNFTFCKEPLGLEDPEKEIIRDAKVSFKKLTPKSGTKTPRLLSPKIASPKVSTPKVAPAKISSPKVASAPPSAERRARTLGNIKKFQVKLPPSKVKLEKKSKSDGEMEVDAPPAKKTVSKKTAKVAPTNLEAESKPCQPCSIRCQGVLGMVPTLQCRLCLCLYHYECVGVTPHELVEPYICKNCQLELGQNTAAPSPSIALPPLTPVNTLKPATTTQQNVLPKLQRIPRGGNDSPLQLENATPPPTPTGSTPRFPPPIFQFKDQQKPPSETKSLLGSLTTWLPHSSTIQVNKENEPVEPPRPQYVEYLAGRKFLIIPKHNVVSISPNLNKTPFAPFKENVEQTAKQINNNNGENPEVAVADVCAQEPNQEIPEQVESPRTKKRPTRINVTADKVEEPKFMDNYLQNLSYGYNTLLYVFQYLKVQDLLRAGCVCTMWRDIASHPSLWRTVRMKNSQVHSFEGLANSLQKHGTVHLDLRKMLLPTSGGDEIWPEFSKSIQKVQTLRKIELCRCPASVVEQLPIANKELEVINAVTIKCDSMSLDMLSSLKNLKELRLKSTSGLTLNSDITALKELTHLTHLSLTSIKDLNKMDLSVISALTSLESLDLGECTDFPSNLGEEILVKLVKLEKLRLEKGQGICHTFEILNAVKNMPQLEQLELVNFDIKSGFDIALGGCKNIRKLLIIPTYISQSATTNHMVLGGVLRLQSTLSHFVWGVTLELLRVTELFVDQCEDPDKKEKKEKKPVGNGDSIPVLKPIPLITDKNDKIPPAHDPPQVEILPLPNLQKLLLQSLPTTRVKILKIPFHATWRQSITDTVN